MIPTATVHPESPHDPAPSAHASSSMTSPWQWSVRRELWENRSIQLAPLLVTAVVLFASLIALINLPHKLEALTAEPAKQYAAAVKPFRTAPAPIMLTTFLVGFFYSLDALYGERRDRSILFWKSMPVSDRTTVLSKASIPLVVLPLIGFALSAATQLVMLPVANAVLIGSGLSPARFWAQLELFPGLPVMVYGLAVHTLWFAPIYGWLLLVSGWARRSPVLWVALPPIAIGALEKIAFNTTHFAHFLRYRVTGAMEEGFSMENGHLGPVDPARFLSAPGLWIGLLFAAACLAAAVRLRRWREPI